MAFQYSCFISYRRGVFQDIVDRLCEKLKYYLAAETQKEIYIDSRLEAGELFNQTLADAMCQSVCMVMLYTPVYFNRERPYCATEYKAMEQLEEERLAWLPETERKNGLIVPVILRGLEGVPQEVRSKRQLYNLANVATNPDFNNDSNYAKSISDIAAYIGRMCAMFDSLDKAHIVPCERFRLPDKEDIADWLKASTPSLTPFPGRR